MAIVSSLFFPRNMSSDGCDAQEVDCRHESGGLGSRCSQDKQTMAIVSRRGQSRGGRVRHASITDHHAAPQTSS